MKMEIKVAAERLGSLACGTWKIFNHAAIEESTSKSPLEYIGFSTLLRTSEKSSV